MKPWGANAAGRISDAELLEIENTACPGAGACGGQYTANTMATALEFLGLSPMGSSSVPATDARKDGVAFEAGKLVMDLVRSGTCPGDLISRQSFDNAIASVAATGGSTNAVLHFLALAREMGVDLEIDDFDKISLRTPLIADLKPGGRFVAVDVDRAGGVPVIARRLVEGGFVDPDQKTVTGRTLGEECRDASRNVGPGGVAPAVQPGQEHGRTGDPARKPGPGRMRDQGGRPREALPPRAGACLRSGGAGHGGRDPWRDPGG